MYIVIKNLSSTIIFPFIIYFSNEAIETDKFLIMICIFIWYKHPHQTGTLVTHVWYLNCLPSYIANHFGKPLKELEGPNILQFVL